MLHIPLQTWFAHMLGPPCRRRDGLGDGGKAGNAERSAGEEYADAAQTVGGPCEQARVPDVVEYHPSAVREYGG